MNRGSVASASYHGRSGHQYRPELGMPFSYAVGGEAMRKRQQQYVSDPTLLDGKAESGEDSGRRSVQDNYNFASEAKNSNEGEERKAKKKKMKKFKSFMHVFLGGLNNRKHLDAWDGDASYSGQYHQKKATRSSVADVPTSPRPPSHHGSTEVPRPGLCGLYNHGNTCFMNAILQCLSNTDQLAEYFVTDQYKNDLNRQKVSARSQGEVTEQFAILLKCLWNCQYDPRVTSHFKDVVARYAAQYQGASQHDAQEFFLWLLDSVHEDLNQASRKKYRPIKDGAGRPDEEVAAETLQSHRKRNNSFIQNLFQGQFRSGVTCPACGTRSATFDPYVCVSLPLPQRERRPVYVTVVYRSSSRGNRVYGVNSFIDSTIRDLRNNLAEMCGINRYHLVLTDLHPNGFNGFNRTFYDDQHLSVINSGDMIFGFECPPYRGDNPEALTHANPSGSKELMLILVVNKLGQTQFGKRFGPPLILRVWRDLTHSQFQSVVLKALAGYLREGIRLADVCRSGVLFRCKVMDALPGRAVLPTDVDHPFYSPSIDKALHVSMLYGGPAHIKLVAEWDPEIKARVFGVVPDEVPAPHQSVLELQELYQQPLTASLNDCLKIYTKEETLNREDSWFCPHCKHQQQDATKKITLWTLPDVLVIHLKRFRHIGYCRTKLNTLVSFPTQGLDMTQYLAPRTTQRPSSATMQRRVQLATSRSKTFASHSKSVRFEETSASKNFNRSMSTKESRFHFPWKKRKDEEHSTKCPEAVYTANVCDSPSSIRSAPSTVGHAVAASRGKRVYSPVHSLDGNQMRSVSPAGLDAASAENVYDLYAVCNHMGTMTRGHYIAYCRNPADGQWYMFDDNHVQSLPQEQLVTAGAYLLFYVRQSLINQLPPLSSTSSSSSSSGGSSHWAMHIPRFRLDLTGSFSSSGSPYSPNINDTKTTRSRFDSSTSAVSAPPLSNGRGISPQSYGAHDNESDVFVQSRGATDNHSAVSLPSSQLNTPLHHHQLSSPGHQVPNNVRTNARQASLRVKGQQQFSSDSLAAHEQFMQRGASFHGSRQHQTVQRSLTDSGRVLEMPPHPAYPYSGQSLVMPSRSIPNIATAEYPSGPSFAAVPSRSISDMPAHLSPPPSARQDHSIHFRTPQPHRARTFSAAHNKSGTESCV